MLARLARAPFALLLALTALALGTVPAGAASERLVTVKGGPAEGPSQYDRVRVIQVGKRSARRVLVLVPGQMGGAGSLRLVAHDIADRLKDFQVWAIDRRTNTFEDTTGFGTGDPDRAFDYYLNGGSIDGRQHRPVQGRDVPFVRSWGLEVSVEDVRRVVSAARKGGRQVVLGGHSLGASTAVAYASWDFKGRGGYRDLDGLVAIDGGWFGLPTPSLAAVMRQIEELEKGDPFRDDFRTGLPWATGVVAELEGLYARVLPNERSRLQDFPLIPSAFKPPVPATNEGFFGYGFDADTGPSESFDVHVGSLAPEGDPRPWQDGELLGIQRLARLFSTEPANFVEWYFPQRLSIDVFAATRFKRTSVTDFLELRLFHRRRVDVPLFAYQTDLTRGGVLSGARGFVKASDVPRATYVEAPGTGHLDPVAAEPGRNRFLKTLIPFLKSVRDGR
jgi:pimeloyl-ACP methyl ester carboxylesterase